VLPYLLGKFPEDKAAVIPASGNRSGKISTAQGDNPKVYYPYPGKEWVHKERKNPFKRLI
jgi:hypothetical protein